MRTVKRLDWFLLKTFLPLFFMTFGICLFIFLMQFLWQYVDDMVGKGIEIHILAELFFYASLTFVPRALPLAILFASLMTFGNLGEQFELIAMKASGISLMRIMKPMTVFLVFISITAFFFQNNIIPVSQVKFYTLLLSVKEKSPELEIPEGTFYKQIRGKNVFVRSKDKGKKLLKGVMIYDYEDGFNNARVIMADSGRIKTSTDKKYLVLSLYSGESFENLKGNKSSNAREAKEAVPYRRESFDTMEMLIEFDGNFNMRDDSLMQNRYIGKNIAELQQYIDSTTVYLDSIRRAESTVLYAQSYRKTLDKPKNTPEESSKEISVKSEVRNNPLNFDSLYNAQKPAYKASVLSYSKRNIERLQIDYGFKSQNLRFDEKEINRNYAEMHRKFTLSFACLIFFFIGAPLGAIIRKGGLGTPAVISVILFVVYYIIDNMGYKMARDGVWTPWIGMWLSSIVLLPLGVFLTYKAVNDSVILNADTYVDAFKRLIGKRELRKIEIKEVIMKRPDYAMLMSRLEKLKDDCDKYLLQNKRWMSYMQFWKQGGIDSNAAPIAQEVENVVDILSNSEHNLILNKTMDFPIINGYHLVDFNINSNVGTALALCFPIGGIVYLIAVYRRKLLRQDIRLTSKVCGEIVEIINDKNIK